MESTGTDLQKNFTTVIIISRKTQAPVLVYFMQKGKNMGLTLKEKQEKVSNLRPIDDVFFEVLARKKVQHRSTKIG